jgi:hypothetical protein
MPFPVDAKFVAQTEAKLGVRLPLGYVAQMLPRNGGSVAAGGDHWDLYPIFDDSDKKRLKRTCNDVVRETRRFAEWKTYPQGAIAIGGNGGGDQLVLLRKVGDSRLGDEVFWWDHETGDVHSVADDFADLKKFN